MQEIEDAAKACVCEHMGKTGYPTGVWPNISRSIHVGGDVMADGNGHSMKLDTKNSDIN